MENYGYYPEDEESVKKGFTVGKLFKYIGLGIILAVWIIMLLRIWLAGDTSFSKSFMWTESSLSAYESDPDSFEILEYDLHSYTKNFENPDGSIESERFVRNNITDDGYFQVTNMMYVEATKELQAIIDLPLQIDTSNPTAMEKALRIYNGKAMINSVNGKKESMDAVFPLAKKYGGLIVALTLDESGIPAKAEDRVVSKRGYYGVFAYGQSREDASRAPLCIFL